MKTLFDATWIAENAFRKVMHGGLRVTYELCKRLVNSKEIDVYLTHTTSNLRWHKTLLEFAKNEYGIGKNKIEANFPLLLRLHHQLEKSMPGLRGRSFLARNTDFIKRRRLTEYKVYHSPVGLIPPLIYEAKNITPFFTALDLIPFVRPEIAPWWYLKYGTEIYDSLQSNTIFLAISESTKNDLLNYRKDLKPEQVVVTYIAADRTIFFVNKCEQKKKDVFKKYNIRFDNYVFALNRPERYKNVGHILECFDRLTSLGYLKDTGFILIGKSIGKLSDNDYQEELRRKYSDKKQIQFIEYVDDTDLSVIYSNALCFVYMSLYEGFGLPILEAMQCGTPVICSNTSSMPEVIGDSGICIDPTDKDLLCDAILKIHDDATLAEKYSQMGLQRSERFSWDQYTADVICAYKEFTN